jgi:plastocyanin
VASLNPLTGAVNELKMSDKSTGLVSGPAGLALDETGGVWFAKLEGKLGHIVSPYSSINVVDIPQEARRPAGITLDSQGNVWMVALDGNAIVRYNPAAEQFNVFPVPTGEPDEKPSVPPFAKTSRPFGIATDHEGNVWFSEQYTGKLGVLDTAPAFLKVFAPQGVVRSATPLFSTQVLDRVSGIQKVTLKIDSSPIQLEHGHIDLQHTFPGHHVLSVLAVSNSGLTSQTTTEFDYAPGQQVLLDQLRALQPIGGEGRRLKTELLDKAAASQKDDLRARIGEIDSSVKQHNAAFKPFNRKLFFAVLDAQLASGGRAVSVSVTDSPPYFVPAELIVHKGDVVAWKYDPPSDGHSISHELHRIEISADARSSLIRAGEGFSYKFDALGEFVIHDSQHPGDSRLTVRVEK